MAGRFMLLYGRWHNFAGSVDIGDPERSRSGVVSARALTFMGVPVGAAIAALRAARGSNALFNAHFVEWLYDEAGDDDRAAQQGTTGG
jgi:hypothetical protein